VSGEGIKIAEYRYIINDLNIIGIAKCQAKERYRVEV